MKLPAIKRFLRSTELFQILEEDHLSAIAEACKWREFPAGNLLFERATPIEEILLIIRGSVQVFTLNTEGDRESLTIFAENEFLGETLILHPQSTHAAFAEVHNHCEVLVVDGMWIRNYLKEHGDAALKLSGQIVSIITRRMKYASPRRENVSHLYHSTETRVEHDLLGEKEVPKAAYYGVQTLRAMENFDISGILLNFYPLIIQGLSLVKKAAAKANAELGNLPEPIALAISQACEEVYQGMLHNHFIVDMVQGGAGTSINMNANEVIANRALEILGKEKGDYQHCHPNNHVNLSQSTNDAYPTAVKIALYWGNQGLIKVLKNLVSRLEEKAFEFRDVIKMGRTQLQDAVPMTLGMSFQAFSSSLKNEIQLLNRNAELFLEVNMGGTAIGTGLNADPAFRKRVLTHLQEITGLDIQLAKDLIESTHDTGAFVMYSSALKRLAIKLSKISNDLRLLSSGPRAGLNEINLPPMQPGSSIMPGKVNPVIPEVINQIAFKVVGNDLCVTMAAEAAQLELNVMEPVIVESLFESIEMLSNGIDVFGSRCIMGITANPEVCQKYVDQSIGLVTALNPHLGYEISTRLAAQALDSGKSIRDLVLEQELMPKEDLDRILNPKNMV